MKTQEVYINLDDSGNLCKNENICVYGGIVFLSKIEKDKFITQYKSIINEIKCSYCYKRDNCNMKCPEIKNTNVLPKHKRRILNYIKKYYTGALIIKNNNVYNYIKENKSAKGRYIDYSIRRLVKEILKNLITNKRIDPTKPIKIIVNIDEQSTKSNGYYNLHDGIVEEIKYGINNFNYSALFMPIIYNELDVSVSYQNSNKCYVIQAADFLAGTIRRKTLDNLQNFYCELEGVVDSIIVLP